MKRFDDSTLLMVHDQVADLGGNERCLAALLDRYPNADAFAPAFDSTVMFGGAQPEWARRTRTVGPSCGRRRGFLSPLYARRVAAEPIDHARIVLSMTHGGWSLAVRVAPGVPHVVYSAGVPCHLWDQVSFYLRDQPLLARAPLAAAVPFLRAHWLGLMRRPTRVLVNSHYSERRMEAKLGRPVDVVYPPVGTEHFTPADPGRGPERRHFLLVARLTAQKRVDLAIDAFRGLDEELVITGDGTDRARLEAMAPPNVRFAGAADDDDLLDLYRSSKALICPSIETFGIVIGEALASGTPVIARAEGGALEIVRHGETGVLLDHVSPRAIAEAVRAVGERRFDPRACRESVERFATRRFADEMDSILQDELARAEGTRTAPIAGDGEPVADAA